MYRLASDLKWIPAMLFACAAISFIFGLLDSTALVNSSPDTPWSILVNLNHNGFHTWRLDHLSALFSRCFPEINLAERPIVGCYLLFIGSFIFLIFSDPKRSLQSVIAPLGSLLTLAFLLTITGLDPVVIGGVAWLPLLALAASFTITSHSPVMPSLVLALISFESAYSANQVSIVSCATALWLAYLLSLSKPSGPRRYGLASLIAFTPAVIATLTAPMATIPGYPKSAHVLPFDGVYGTLRPLIGPMYPFDVLDRAAIRSIYDDRSLALLLLAIVAFWVRRRHQSAVARYTGKVGLFLAFLATLNTCLPEPWATISPLPSLSRLIPWGISYSITSVALGLSAWMTATSLVLNTAGISLVTLTCTGLIVTLIGTSTIFKPVLREVNAVNDPAQRAILLTPSAAILRSLTEAGLEIPKQLQNIRQTHSLTSKDIRDLGAEISIYPEPDKARLSSSQSGTSWRWSTHTGTQTGDEVLTIKFQAPINLSGIELDPGPYFTDYPRGLRIHGGGCERASAQLIADYPIWQGSLHILHRGVPYYAPRNEVRVVFSDPITAQCLFIYQTGKAPFDWSVSRIKVISN